MTDHTTKLSPSLSKYLADCGVCSRRKAVEFIEGGGVSINHEVVTEPGYHVQPSDVVRYKKKVIKPEEKIYIILNNPVDYLTTVKDEKNRKIVLDLVKGIKQRVFPVGRLDRDTTGLLLLTNDGGLALKLSHPRYNVKKIYRVVLNRPLSFEDADVIRKGLRLRDGFMKVDALAYPNHKNRKQLSVELHSGKNRIVRRIFAHVGYKVVRLERYSYAGLTLKGSKRGQWRLLTKKEIEQLKRQESNR